MNTSHIVHAWGRILTGRRPSMSIEITRECPLRCPGCYAYGDQHLGDTGVTLRQLADYKGDELVTRVLQVVDEHKPLHLSIVGGDPLVRYREVEKLLPELGKRGIHVQLVTSAFRVVPVEWTKLCQLNIVVSVDGLPPEHDVRRTPATYERILKSLQGHKSTISIHCTLTSQQVQRAGYIREFLAFWSAQESVKRVWFSIYTPQIGEVAEEILSPAQRKMAAEEMLELRKEFPKLDMAPGAIKHFLTPPQTPDECTFAKTTHTLSADLVTKVTPCQFGGKPDCAQCGCVASMGLFAVANHRLGGKLRVGDIFDLSFKIGEKVNSYRRKPEPPRGPLVNIKAVGS